MVAIATTAKNTVVVAAAAVVLAAAAAPRHRQARGMVAAVAAVRKDTTTTMGAAAITLRSNSTITRNSNNTTRLIPTRGSKATRLNSNHSITSILRRTNLRTHRHTATGSRRRCGSSRTLPSLMAAVAFRPRGQAGHQAEVIHRALLSRDHMPHTTYRGRRNNRTTWAAAAGAAATKRKHSTTSTVRRDLATTPRRRPTSSSSTTTTSISASRLRSTINITQAPTTTGTNNPAGPRRNDRVRRPHTPHRTLSGPDSHT